MNNYGSKAQAHLMEYCPSWYSGIEDKQAYFTEIGNEAQRQVSSAYSKISLPELGENDQAAWQMANEMVHDLIYPMPEEGHQSGWWEDEDEANSTAALRMEFVALEQQMIDEADEEEVMAALRRDFPEHYPEKE